MNVFDLFAKLSLDSSEYDKGLEQSESKASKFGSAAKKAGGIAAAGIAAATGATIAAGKAFVDGVASVASYTDHVDKMSQKMGVSSTFFQEFDFIAQHCGTSMDSLKTSMKTLATAAETGNEAFEKLGMTQEEIANMSQEELFEATITALQGVEDEQTRMYLSSKLLGKGATELGAMLNMSTEEMASMKDEAHSLGGVLDEDTIKSGAAFQDSLQNMQTSLDGMKNRLLGDFMPALTTTMDGLTMIFSGQDVDGGIEKIGSGIQTLASQLVQKAPEVMKIGGTILKALLTSITENLPILLDSAVPIVMELASGIISAAPDILSAVLSLIGTIGSALGDPANLESLLETAMSLVMMISDAIATNAPTVIPAIVELIMTMLTALTDESTLMPLLSAGLSVIVAVVQGILKAIPVLIKNLPAIISNITNFLVNSTPLIISAAIQLLGGIISAIPEIIVELGKATPQIISSLVSGLLGGIGQIVSVGGQLLAGLWQGISDKVGWIVEKIKGFGNTVMSTIKGIFGIASPSKVFRDEVGAMLALGLGEGFEDEMSDVSKEMAKSASGLADDVNNALDPISVGATLNANTMKATGGFDSTNARIVENIGAIIDEKLSNISFTINNPVYIGQKKIDQQVKTATAHNNVISGGR